MEDVAHTQYHRHHEERPDPPAPTNLCCSRTTLAGSIAIFGVQYNFTNISVALLYLSESGSKWYSHAVTPEVGWLQRCNADVPKY